MQKEDYKFSFEVYNSIDELSVTDAKLLLKAREVTQQAYAPYSQFYVGAIAMLTNGETVSGTNQENASFPVGLCAERALLAAAATLFPDVAIDTVAISYNNNKGESNRPISPCGMCRQALSEFEVRVNQPIRIILGGLTGQVYIIASASLLLPLTFTAKDLAGK